MSNRFTSKPSVTQLAATVFWSLVFLNLALGFASLLVARFGPLRGTFLDFYFISSAGLRSALGVMHLGSLLSFVLIWLASPRLRHQHRWLSLIVFILGFFMAALPG